MVTSKEIRKKFLEYFKAQDHAIIPSAPVVPENDPTVLFNTAGMQPLVPYLLGEKHPLGTRLADSQKCIRTVDIEEVGDNSHLTYFEMLGNWSLGDYFKKESIDWSYDLLVHGFGIDPKKLAVTVFEGDEDAPRDEESADIWFNVGIPRSKISYLPKSENWWGPAGETGPCGPDSEIFYWVGEGEFPPEDSNVENDEDNWMEIWNNVFMEYVKDENGNFNKANQQNVDTGMGLERIVTVLNGKKSVYDTDLFDYIIKAIEEVLNIKYDEDTMRGVRIIADHTRTAVIMISDGITPSNVDQGYVLRRLIRRAIREAHKFGFEGEFMKNVAEVIVNNYSEVFPNIKENGNIILEEIEREEKQFLSTLKKGLKEFEKLLKGFEIALERTGKKVDIIAGPKAFKLYDTYGFPIEMTVELAEEKGLKVDVEGFEKAFEEHQAKSRAGAEKKFKGGLADDSEATTALHSATHLLLAALQEVLGDHVHQAGSNITADRLRFDFTHGEKVSREDLDKVEEIVNNIISKNCVVILENMSKQDAMNSGVEASFWDRYPDTVKVYTFKSKEGEVMSKELCGGPHVENTQGMGRFKIKKEQASSRGVRRIKAVLIKD
ncbi:MAG: alanine--tRNA ligase [Candidatus Gracilibacteria bacterium]|nr:alanine--tRNA ligase [Candidatus Gracilibacteria bacterium]